MKEVLGFSYFQSNKKWINFCHTQNYDKINFFGEDMIVSTKGKVLDLDTILGYFRLTITAKEIPLGISNIKLIVKKDGMDTTFSEEFIVEKLEDAQKDIHIKLQHENFRTYPNGWYKLPISI